MKRYGLNRGRAAALVAVAIAVAASAAYAARPCSVGSCRDAARTRCADLRGRAKRKCKRAVPRDCRAGSCACTDGAPASCATVPTTTVTSTTSTAPTTTTGPLSSTTTTTLVSGCFTATGDGTIHDGCSGLQWETKTPGLGLHGVDARYSWAGCCNGSCASIASYCQPDAEAAATCAAHSDGGTQGCGVCATGTCDVDPFGQGVVTTVWAWLNQLNAASFAGHGDWRLPREGGHNQPSSGADELESLLLAPYPCGTSPCVDAILGPTPSGSAWSASTFTAGPDCAWYVGFGDGHVAFVSKANGFAVRAVR